MTTATVAILKDAYESSPKNAAVIRNVIGLGNKFDEKRVKEWLDDVKANHLSNDLHKGTRPWELVNMTAKLDPKQPWFGIEYETGYKNKTEYQNIINYLWRHHPLTAIDHEGCGNYPCEITFGPVNMDTFMADNYSLDRLIIHSVKNAPKASHSSSNMVGTHVNISTPRYRVNTQRDVVVGVLNNSIRTLTATQMKQLFGRTPYGYFYSRSDGDVQYWIEGKLFNSVGDVASWRAYKPVMARLATVVEQLCKKPLGPHRVPKVNPKGVWPPPASILTITNFYQMLTGEADKIVLEMKDR